MSKAVHDCTFVAGGDLYVPICKARWSLAKDWVSHSWKKGSSS